MNDSKINKKNTEKKNIPDVARKIAVTIYAIGLVKYAASSRFVMVNATFVFFLFIFESFILLSLFVPALTMRLFAEEKRSGSIETLLTLPLSVTDVVAGKFFAAWIFSLTMIAPTLLYIIPLVIFGTPDAGPIIGGFIGAGLLCAAFSAIGVFTSSLTKNQIIAFFAALAICIVLTMIDTFLVFLPGQVVSFFSYISASAHFTSIARGIIDSRDIIYFVSITVFFFYLTVVCSTNE